MACSPNYQEYAAAGRADKTVVEIHDDRCGRYEHVPTPFPQKPNDQIPAPFTLGDGKKK